MLQTNPSGGFPSLARRRPSLDELTHILNSDVATLPVIAAGVVLRAPDGSILFLKRSPDEKNYANHWALPGGGIEEDESPDDAARRECLEETGHAIDGDLDQVEEIVTGTGKGRFATFENRVPERFEPKFKDGEHTDFVWALPAEAPQPLHPGVANLMKTKYDLTRGATDSALRLAMDRDTVRTIIEDANGEVWRLEISNANLSKATVNPYLGREIPNAEALSLDPDKVYQLLRDPDELRKAVPTANMVQLLRKHIPVSADDPQQWDVVGTTGSSAKFVDPYLQNGLSIWTKEAMEDLEDESKKELSCGYRYRAEMTPGIFAGMRYDGVMRDIKFNHVALVKDGRAGPDVVIGDSNEEIAMADNRDLAKMLAAISARQISVGALCSYLRPRLAKAHLALDSKPLGIMAKVFEGINGKTFKDQKPVIAKRFRELAKPLLAKDASLEQVEQVLDMLDGHEIEGGDASVSPEQHNAMEAAAHGTSNLDIPKKVGEEFVSKDNGAPSEEFSTFMKGKGASDEEVKKAWDMFPQAGKPAVDAEPESDEEKKKKEAELKAAEAKKGEDSKKAMDQAIDAAVTASEKRLRQSFADIEQAKSEIRPKVGDLPATMSFDSAEQVRRYALKMLGVKNHDTMHVDALSTVLSVQPNAGSSHPRGGEPIALDSAATVTDFNKRYPDAARIGTS